MRQFIQTNEDWFVVPQKVMAFRQGSDTTTNIITVDGTEFVIDLNINDFALALNRQLNTYGVD